MTVQQEDAIRSLYQQFIDAWNRRSAQDFAALVAEDGNVVGFDGSQLNGRTAIKAELERIFKEHQTAPYLTKVQEVRFLTPDIAVLRAIVGMMRQDQTDINPAVNAVQSLIAIRHNDQWQIALFQNTPAQFHGRPELVEAMTAELRELL
jgi:uncharacterized protein (TIGR02246 family)